MAKMNYNNFEDALEKSLHAMKVESLLKEADAAQGKKSKNPKSGHSPRQMMTLVKQDLEKLSKQDKTIYKTLNLKKTRVEELIERINSNENKLTKKEMEEIKKVKIKIDKYKKKLIPEQSDEELLEQQVDKHVYKRHNVREKWLPLDTHADWNKHKKSKGFNRS